MQNSDWSVLVLYVLLLCLLAPPLGIWLARVLQGERHFLKPVLGWLERGIYALSGVKTTPMSGGQYIGAVLVFTAVNLVVLLAILLFQNWLPANPQAFPGVSFWLAVNTAVSFVSNTNWQAYSGEALLSYSAQMLGLGVQNFVSAAVGIAAFLAMARGLSPRSENGIGNFWVDVTRSVVYLLLPLSLLLAMALVANGVVQSFAEYTKLSTLEGGEQVLPLGPAASQIAIKQLGTNGGGFFGVNSAHPFENATPFTNFLQMFAILLIPAAQLFTFGKIAGRTREAVSLFAVVLGIFLLAVGVSFAAEAGGNAALGGAPFWEGKEVRHGIGSSALWGVATTAASNGSVNSMHDGAASLSGLVQMLLIQLGEVVFGGVGVGASGLLMYVIVTVFLAGLMAGRTPEYLGKKLERREVQLALLAILIPSALILLFTAVAAVNEIALASRNNAGPHGLSEILYAFSSASGNNGSAFAGLNASTDFYTITQAFCMLVARLAALVPAIAIGASMAARRVAPQSAGAFRTDSVTFAVLLAAMILIIGALTFFPALSLAPVLDHLLLYK